MKNKFIPYEDFAKFKGIDYDWCSLAAYLTDEKGYTDEEINDAIMRLPYIGDSPFTQTDMIDWDILAAQGGVAI